VGSSIQNIEYRVNQIAQTGTYYTVTLGGILTTSKEFVDKMTHYRYFKILGITVVFEPQYIGTGTEMVYVQLNWNNNEVENIINEDSTKTVPFYRTKRITLKYKVPNLEVMDARGYLSLNKWITRDIYNLNTDFPGNFIFVSTAGAQYAIICKIVLRIAFRGSVNVESTSVAKQLEKIKQIEERELENKKEIKEIKILQGLGQEQRPSAGSIAILTGLANCKRSEERGIDNTLVQVPEPGHQQKKAQELKVCKPDVSLQIVPEGELQESVAKTDRKSETEMVKNLRTMFRRPRLVGENRPPSAPTIVRGLSGSIKETDE
jgi:hypothetical protein